MADGRPRHNPPPYQQHPGIFENIPLGDLNNHPAHHGPFPSQPFAPHGAARAAGITATPVAVPVGSGGAPVRFPQPTAMAAPAPAYFPARAPRMTRAPRTRRVPRRAPRSAPTSAPSFINHGPVWPGGTWRYRIFDIGHMWCCLYIIMMVVLVGGIIAVPIVLTSQK